METQTKEINSPLQKLVTNDSLLLYLNKNNLNFQLTPSSGRGIVALKKIEVNELVLKSSPLGFIPGKNSIDKDVCGQCCVKLSDTKRFWCSGCKSIAYCDQPCQLSSWIMGHKWECQYYQQQLLKYHKHAQNVVSKNNPGRWKEDTTAHWQEIVMLRRVCLSLWALNYLEIKAEQLTKNEKQVYIRLKLLWKAQSLLVSHINEFAPDQLAHFEKTAKIVRNQLELILPRYRFDNFGWLPNLSELIKLQAQFHCNNFDIHDSQLYAMGQGTFPIGSLFNHSCSPNVLVLYQHQTDHLTQRMISLCPIYKGQELTICYIDLIYSRQRRQLLLNSKYFFDCNCNRCFNENDDHDKLAQWIGLYKNHPPCNSPLYTAKFTNDHLRLVIKNFDIEENRLSENSLDDLVTLVKCIYIKNSKDVANNSQSLSKDFVSALMQLFIQDIILPIERNTPPKISKQVLNHLTTNSSEFQSLTSKFSNCLNSSDWLSSIMLGMTILTIYYLSYPLYHPIISLHYLTLTKALYNYALQYLKSHPSDMAVVYSCLGQWLKRAERMKELQVSETDCLIIDINQLRSDITKEISISSKNT
ncbi:SET domain-containing protein [Conidiobolus coronatus NRRL 28638]|uniref:SET domain-containing protein n=1 Tax=Conidiobolus coronatus (strain ATCC 28846 / CBS 209.66 / NRRL 28638) TaxID=796925 RepID=A0A137PAD7_CONC2|nr:SET domain-containing protein [Conidiobolus coronatus NRRL 28638]|eukprot:KXN71914.1 SET domain-containing protein [Conidiobolus coronatus NRRL 28638]